MQKDRQQHGAPRRQQQQQQQYQQYHNGLPARPGVSGANGRHEAVMTDIQDRRRMRHDELATMGYAHLAGSSTRRDSAGGSSSASSGYPVSRRSSEVANDKEADKPKKELKGIAYGSVYSPEEESLRNDLGMAYLNTGRRPQNLLQGTELRERFSEYPKLAKLLALHSDLVYQHAHPPIYLQMDLSELTSTTFSPTKFDCILIDPPLEEYVKTHPGRFREPPTKDGKHFWTWDDVATLPIPQLASSPGFIWLWVGSGKADENGISGLDRGREILAKWGYRRCEDIVWLKTNQRKPGLEHEPPTNTLLTHTKEHCLMGIRGTVRRSTDGHFVHCNVDTDVIVWEGDEDDPMHKPPELYNLIENFCMGARRIELFGNRKNLRPGWLTVGIEVGEASVPDGEGSVPAQAYDKAAFDAHFAVSQGSNLVPTTAEVDSLRPRSPGSTSRSASAAANNSFPPGVKSNPQGIGRHTNRAGIPSASQTLEFERLQQQFQQSVYMRTQMELQERQRMEMMQQQQQQAMLLQQQQQQQQAMMMAAMGMGMQMPMGMSGMGMGNMASMGMGMGAPMGMGMGMQQMGFPMNGMQQLDPMAGMGMGMGMQPQMQMPGNNGPQYSLQGSMSPPPQQQMGSFPANGYSQQQQAFNPNQQFY